MSIDELSNDWKSPRNSLSVEERQRLADQFISQMTCQRRCRAIWLAFTFAGLIAATGLAFLNLSRGRLHPGQQWGLLPLLVVPWSFAFHFLRCHLKACSASARRGLSVLDSLGAALEENRREQCRLKKTALLFIIMIPLLAMGMRQLLAVGKITPRELTSMAFLFGAILLVSSAAIAAKYFTKVLPRRRKLDALWAELRDEAS